MPREEVGELGELDSGGLSLESQLPHPTHLQLLVPWILQALSSSPQRALGYMDLIFRLDFGGHVSSLPNHPHKKASSTAWGLTELVPVQGHTPCPEGQGSPNLHLPLHPKGFLTFGHKN